MPELLPYAPGSPEWLAARFTDHWATCDWCQEGLPCAEGDPLYMAMHQAAEETRDTRSPVKLTPWSRIGMIDGAYQAAMPARYRPGWRPGKAHSWMYRRGFARAFLLAREAHHG